jgi:hypothetical protein
LEEVVMAADSEGDGLDGLLATAASCYREMFESTVDGQDPRGQGLDAVERADGDSYFSQMLQMALLFVDADPAETALILPYQTATRRQMDNGPDSVYGMAFVDEAHRYRVRGLRRDECYMAITLYAADSGKADRETWSANHIDLGVAPGESFEVELSPTDGAAWVCTRQYRHHPREDQAGSFDIDVIEGPPSRRASAASRAEGWQRAVRFLKSVTKPETMWDPAPPWVSLVPNTMGDPTGWSAEARRAKDQLYASGTFDLGDDEMLVMETRWPTCAYASATVWNRFSQSIDPRRHRSTINNRSSVAEDDGTVRLVVAARDPGLPNWLDTGGRRRGSVFWRFLLAEGAVQPISSRVVRIGSL